MVDDSQSATPPTGSPSSAPDSSLPDVPSPRLTLSGIQAIVLDIEGTTTPLAFVHQVLFPYVRAHLLAYLEDTSHREALREPLRRLRQECAADALSQPGDGPFDLRRGRASATPPSAPDDAAASPPDEDPGWTMEYVEWLMDRDRKSPALKLLQGLIWQQGYLGGKLQGDVFDDVAPALERWRAARIGVAIYSSGSELAQRMLFATTAHGDLTQLIAGFFDTAVGAKTSVESYRRIADELGCPTARLLFVSDVTTELDAARAAGCQTLLCVRPGNLAQPPHQHPTVGSFDDFEVAP